MCDILVSVIVPVYNVEKYLPICIESILKQSYSNIELLLIDDGSTDASGIICDRYAEQDGRVKVYHQVNSGVSAARNTGLDNMGGEYCITVDSDDAISPLLIERAFDLLQKYKCDCVIYRYDTIKDCDFENKIKKSRIVKGELEFLSRYEVMKEILIGNRFRMLACNKLYRSELWNDIRYPIGRKYGDDTAVTYRLMDKCNRVAYLDEVHYYYRMREGSALHTEVSERNLELFVSYSEMMDYMFKKHSDFSSYAAASYVIRMFDFLAKVKESDLNNKVKRSLIAQLSILSKPYRFEIIRAKNMTMKQKILLQVLYISVSMFYLIYSIG